MTSGNDRPTVLFVHNGLGAGGAERSLAELLPGLVAAGIRPVVVCFYRRAEGVERAVLEQGFDVRFLTQRRTASRALAIRRIIEAEDPDVVHTTIYEANVAGRLAAVGKSRVVVSSLVNTPYTDVKLADPNIRKTSIRTVQAVDGWTARHLTSHFHAITHAVADWAVDTLRLDPADITVVERGRDPRRLGEPSPARRARAREQLGLAPDDRVLVAVGRQEYQKGHRFLLEAMSTLAERPDRVVLLLCGRRGLASVELDRMREALDPDRVRFLGHRDDLPEVLAAADVFVFPSLFEGLGGALIEAMAAGSPVVASDIPAIREVVADGRSATLVPPSSPAPLAAAIGALLDDPARARAFGERGRQIFLERFTLERSTSRMIEMYERLMRRTSAAVGGR